MNRYLRVSVLIAVLCFTKAIAQEKAINKLETIISAGVKKAYPASVRMWGFDTTRNERTSAQFSGVVVSADGYILTAAHTTQPGKNYQVFFPDGQTCIAEALGKIEVKETPGAPDVGLMKILTKGNWPFAEMGYAHSLVKNEMCLSISYPETLNQTLPTIRLGKIAAVKNEYGFIQSTCKMEPGDSGGPLFDYFGRVIGLHSAIDVAEDMNFEIPVDLYRKYWTALKTEKVYTALPQQTDAVNEDSFADQIKKDVLSGKVDFEKVKFAPKFKHTGFLISSLINGVAKTVNATLFNQVDAKGQKKQFLVSKNSMIGNEINLSVDGKTVAAKVIARDKENDLILLQAAIEIKGGIPLASLKQMVIEHNDPKILFTLKQDGTYLQSILSSGKLSLPKVSSMPYFGAMVVYNASPVLFSLIKPGSPAQTAGIQVGDELVSIDGQPITNAADYGPFMTKYWPDDEVNISWKSAGKLFSKNIKLGGVAQGASNHPAEKFAGGKSARRDGFSTVYAHDLALTPDLAGTAVFNGKGDFYGLNIARFSRTAAFFIPADLVYAFVMKY
ncbi:S1C family serine protease [Pedobacter sp. GSP4]|uniref:S1C family serine protease n=1 Tax=Pedobacter sp. GSP4 TaxID=3453716 RepID=UPI003EE878FC